MISVKPGKIAKIKGLEKVKSHPAVVSMFTKYNVGDEVGEYYNVNQRYAEIDLLCDNIEELCGVINWIYNTLIIENEDGENMVFSNVDTNELLKEYKHESCDN